MHRKVPLSFIDDLPRPWPDADATLADGRLTVEMMHMPLPLIRDSPKAQYRCHSRVDRRLTDSPMQMPLLLVGDPGING